MTREFPGWPATIGSVLVVGVVGGAVAFFLPNTLWSVGVLAGATAGA